MNQNQGLRILGQALLALTIGSTVASAQIWKPLPLSYPQWLELRKDPAAMSRLLSPGPAVA